MGKIAIDIPLITKYLAGEATPEEAIAIGDWINVPENKKQFDEAMIIWNMPSKPVIHTSPEIAGAWLQLQDSLSKKSFQKIRIFRRLAAAAVVTGIIVCGFIFYNVSDTHRALPGRKLITIAASKDLLKDTLPDGSVIILNRNSSVQYPESFNKTTRRLSLNGEAYFDVVHDKINPFIINEGELNIKVAGTLFNVSKKESPRSIEVQVQSGLVKMYTSKNEITVSKGQTGVYTEANNLLAIEDSVDINSIGYATGSFSFTNASLSEIAGYLEKAFGVTMLFRNSNLSSCRLTAKFENKSLAYIVHVISVTLNIQSTIQNNTIYIDGNGCN